VKNVKAVIVNANIVNAFTILRFKRKKDVTSGVIITIFAEYEKINLFVCHCFGKPGHTVP